jgi:hypothetical protein
VGMLALATGALASPALGAAPFSGNVCAIPTPAELAAAGITGACMKGHPTVSKSGGVTSRQYSAHWGTAPAESDLPVQSTFLSIKISRLTGPAKKLARVESFERHQIKGNFGHGIQLGEKVLIGHEPGNVVRAGSPEPAQLLFTSGHLYIVLMELKEPVTEGGNLNAQALAEKNELVALGDSAIAAL